MKVPGTFDFYCWRLHSVPLRLFFLCALAGLFLLAAGRAHADDALDSPATASLSHQPSTPSAVTSDLAAQQTPAAKKKEADISSFDLKELLGTTIDSGHSGSFGYRLQSYGVQPYLHGYAVVDWSLGSGEVNSFDLHYFNVFVGANILDIVIPELQLEHEHGGEEIQLRFAQVDVVAISDLLHIRAGLFLVPFGSYNEFLYPEFIAKLPDRPMALRTIVPVSWAEVGVQARGVYALTANVEFNYALYLVNGLEQQDDPDVAGVDDGGNIRSMRYNYRDKHNDDKAVGGRLGVEAWGFEGGLSAYTGAYSEDGQQRLSMGGVDVAYNDGDLSVHAEYVVAWQTRAVGDLLKHGGYALVSYALLDSFQPVLQIDGISEGRGPNDNRLRATLGVNFLPFPDRVYNLVVKASYAATLRLGAAQKIPDSRGVVQLALGF